jgi:hypothetical protein
MDSPNYVLQAHERVFVPKNDNPMLGVVKVAVWVIVAVLILGSFIFGENLFGNLTWTARISFIVIAIMVCFIGGSKQLPSPFEIRFYDDYLVVYRKSLYYNRRTSSMVFFKFYYKDIKKCEYDEMTHKTNIWGYLEATWYNYNKDGTLPQNPTKQKRVDSICQFHLMMDNPKSFITEFETHSSHSVNFIK